MCGRFTLDPTTKFYERFDISNRLDDLVPRYNIAPGQMVPIITRNSPNKVEMMKWGLIPKWAKDSKIGYKLINARAETVAEKPSYRHAFKNSRCLVPASGFYEWRRNKDSKTPFYIHEKKEPLFAIAGLYEVWVDPKGVELKTFTIITTSPNSLMSKIHDRMPVILKQEDEIAWLTATPVDAIKLLKPFSNTALEAYPVSPLVNSPKNYAKELINPIS